MRLKKFGFLIHPLDARDLKKHPLLRGYLGRVLPEPFVENLFLLFPPISLGEIEIVAKVSVRGHLYAIPYTRRLLLEKRFERYFNRRLLQVCRMANAKGDAVLGLGAFTSVVGDAGVTLSSLSPIPVTSGNSLTVYATAATVRKMVEFRELEPQNAVVGIFGGTGSIGRALSLFLADSFGKLIVVGRNEERVRRVVEEIKERKGIECEGAVGVDLLPEMDVVVTATTSLNVLPVDKIKEGAIVVDVGQPPNVSRRAGEERKDVLFVKGGEIAVREVRSDFRLPLPQNTLFACLAETAVLAAVGCEESFSVGRELDEERVMRIGRWAEELGFSVGEPRDLFTGELLETKKK